MKYHITKNGEVGVCTAKERDCPFGGEHYDSLKSAQTGLENRMTKDHDGFVTLKKTESMGSNPSSYESTSVDIDTDKPLYTASETSLSSIMDKDLLNSMINEEFISISSHPDNPALQVLSYKRKAQIEGRWNEATKQCRGLIIYSENEDFSDAVVIERPWRKFFTLSQMTGNDGQKAWALGDEDDGPQTGIVASIDQLDFTAPAEVTDKLDGSMGVLYHAPDGKLAFSTKGSFKSDQAKMYTKLLREDPTLYDAAEKLKRENPNTTFLFELVGSDNQIVILYDDDEAILLGAVDVDTGMYHSTREYTDTWNSEKGLNSAKVMEAGNLQEALELSDRDQKEGVVVRIASDDPNKQVLVKFKQEEYLEAHRILTNLSEKRIFETTVSGSYDSFMSKLAPKNRITQDKLHNELIESFETKKSKVTSDFEKLKNQETKRDFALAIKDHPYKHSLFALWDGIPADKTLWRYVEREQP